MEKKKSDWINYRQLKKDEIIEKDDEVLCDSKIGWVTTNESCVGTRTPDPQYSSHRIYRRNILNELRTKKLKRITEKI
jgi:hypothetical protein